MELDKEQTLVVDSNESMVCLAGPGSGKTRVLTEKARKVFNGGKSTLCLTFTRSAAREMQERVPGLPACTIHSFCCGVVGWNEDWGYPGLLYRFLMEKDKPQMDWLLLDESQDVNEMELDVVLSLVGDKIFAVGDPFQSIYGFQGAMGPKIIPWMKAMRCEEVTLHNNYRSCPEIVSQLNKIYNRDLVSKNIKDTGLTCILCRTNDDVFYVSKALKSTGIPHRIRLSTEFADRREYDVIEKSDLRLMTIHCAKGLEFDRVVLFSWQPTDGLEEEKRVYYVANSRASKEFKRVWNLEELYKEVRLSG